jgi:putative ABC transport system permease protein
MVALVGGVLLACPLALRALAALAAHRRVAVRLAVRDLARYQARSAAALAAISLALGIPATAAITANAAEATADEGPGNLSTQQAIVRVGEGLDPQIVVASTGEQRAGQNQAVDRIDEQLGDPTVLTLEMAVDPSAEPVALYGGTDLRGRFAAGVRIDGGDPYQLYVASPELLELYGLDPSLVDADAEVLVPREGEYVLLDPEGNEEPVEGIEVIDVPGYESTPRAFITAAGLRNHGWEASPSGWFVQSDRAFTSDQLAEARQVAGDVGFSIEVHDDNERASIGPAAVAAGALIALAVLALTVGLIRAETLDDMRMLTATGASGRIRRTINASTAGGLALLGALLGTAGAYAAVLAGYHSELGALGDVPFVELVALLVGVPVLAVTAGWLVAGPEVRSLARRVLE